MGPADSQDRWLRGRCPGEILLGAFGDDPRDLEAPHVIGFVEYLACFCRSVDDVPAHTRVLRSLSGKHERKLALAISGDGARCLHAVPDEAYHDEGRARSSTCGFSRS